MMGFSVVATFLSEILANSSNTAEVESGASVLIC